MFPTRCISIRVWSVLCMLVLQELQRFRAVSTTESNSISLFLCLYSSFSGSGSEVTAYLTTCNQFGLNAGQRRPILTVWSALWESSSFSL